MLFVSPSWYKKKILEREILNHVEVENFWKLNLEKLKNQIFEFSAQFAFLIRS